MTIKITRLELKDSELRDKVGEVLLCNFDCDLGSIVMLGCSILQGVTGFARFSSPSTRVMGAVHSTKVTDLELRGKIIRDALGIYEKMGGKHRPKMPIYYVGAHGHE